MKAAYKFLKFELKKGLGILTLNAPDKTQCVLETDEV